MLEMSHPIMMNPANNIVMATKNGKSLFKVVLSINNSLSNADKPITIKMLNMLLPITVLTASALLPVMEDVMETAASGALVPSATIVNPTIIVGIFKSEAMLLAPSTKKSEPFIKNMNPTINNKT